MVKEAVKHASSHSTDLACLATVLTREHNADLASAIESGDTASLDSIGQLKVLFSVIDGDKETPKKLTEAFIRSGIAVVSKTIRSRPADLTGLCQDLRSAANQISLEFLTGSAWIGFVKSVLKFCMK